MKKQLLLVTMAMSSLNLLAFHHHSFFSLPLFFSEEIGEYYDEFYPERVMDKEYTFQSTDKNTITLKAKEEILLFPHKVIHSDNVYKVSMRIAGEIEEISHPLKMEKTLGKTSEKIKPNKN